MKLAAVIPLCLFALMLGGCEISGPKLKLEPPKVRVPVDVEVEGDGHFCPPGQAKKGNC